MAANIPDQKAFHEFEPNQEQIEQIYRPDVDTSGIDEKKLMRRVDWHVIPWLALLYLLNFLDRGSIGNAKVRDPTIFYICLFK